MSLGFSPYIHGVNAQDQLCMQALHQLSLWQCLYCMCVYVYILFTQEPTMAEVGDLGGDTIVYR